MPWHEKTRDIHQDREPCSSIGKGSKHIILYMLRVLLLIIMTLSGSLHAASYDAIISAALSVSPDAQAAELSYQAGLLSIAEAELDDEYDISITASVSPLADDMQILGVDDLSFSMTLPDDDTTITASLPFGIRYDSEGATLQPGASISHTFDWGRDTDTLEDLQVQALRISVEHDHASDLIAVRRSVISLMLELLTNDRNILEAEENLRDAEKELSDSLSLGIVSEDSIAYMELELSSRRYEDSLRILEEERTELEMRYASMVGSEWSGVDSIPYPSFPVLDPASSSTLLSADIQAAIAGEEVLVEESRQNPLKLIAGAEVSASADISNGIYSDPDGVSEVASLMGSLGWEGANWSLSASGGGSFSSDHSFTPALTFSGSWKSGTSRSDEITLRSLRNTALILENEAKDARRTFSEESSSLWRSILAWEREEAEMKAQLDYEEALAEMADIKHERGIISDEDLHDTMLSLSLLKMDRDILLLEGLELQAEAEALLL